MLQQTNQPVSKKKIYLIWFYVMAFFLFLVTFWCWIAHGSQPQQDSTPFLFRLIAGSFLGILFLGIGCIMFFVIYHTNCFTFNVDTPCWNGLKARLFLANIFVPFLPVLGLGVAMQPLFTPILISFGIDSAIANLLPIFFMIGIFQIVQLKVMIWSPVEKRFIYRRLKAQGVTEAQIQSGFLTGISNPVRSSLAKGIIEDDMGVLWVGPDQLIFYGDMERFAISRDQLIQMERKGDSLNQTALSGITHVILHVRTPESQTRQIRLHVEGAWNMEQKRRGMDQMAEQITRWYNSAQSQ